MQYDELDPTGRDEALDRLDKYMKYDEPTVPDPYAMPTIGETNAYVRTMVERHQERAVEFWLRCREPIARKRYDYWQVKGDYLRQVGRHRDALEAFREELVLRLSFFKPDTTQPRWAIDAVRARAEERLLQCMNPKSLVPGSSEPAELQRIKDLGQFIYNKLAEAETTARLQLLPRKREIHAYYKLKDEEPHDDAKSVSTTGEAKSRQTRPSGTLDAVLARAGAEAHAQLHNIGDLPQVRETFGELIRALHEAGFETCGKALTQLFEGWTNYATLTSRNDRIAALTAAQNLMAETKGKFQTQLRGNQRLLATQLLEALDRATGRLAKALKLLPTLRVDTIDGTAVTVDPTVTNSSFAVRVGTDTDDMPVLLASAVAVPQGSVSEFRLKDDLEKIPVTVGPGQSALLTFGFSSWPSDGVGGEVRIEVRYKCGAGTFESFHNVPLRYEPRPTLPHLSPYIYGRKLEPDEIDGHFFGRDREQKEILDSISNGQQKIRYIEGIRRAGKSSLLSSVTREIARRTLPLIPVYWSPAGADSLDHVGKVFHDLLDKVSRAVAVEGVVLDLPSEQECCANLPRAYTRVEDELAAKCPVKRAVVLVDDFQTLVEAAFNARSTNVQMRSGILGLLNVIYDRANPAARLLWVFAGQRAFRQYRTLLSGALLWGTTERLPVDFLPADAVAKIVIAPLASTPFLVPPETIARVHMHTAGHPEVVQELAAGMLERAIADQRHLITPSDADSAAIEIAAYSDGFAETWYPVGELSPEQRGLIASFVNAVPVGGRIQPHLLVKDRKISEVQETAIDDLVARKILITNDDGTIGIKARILDAWLHRIIPTMITDRVNGSVAVFVDVANLTSGTGAAIVDELQTVSGEDGMPGRFRLATVLDRIEEYVKSLSPAPRGPRWAVNYPKASPAVTECNAKDFSIENVPKDLWDKGDDDRILIEKITDIERGYPNVSHFVLVLGDKGYRPKAESLLRNGKNVYIVSPQAALAGRYNALAAEFPDQMRVMTLETLLDRQQQGG